MEKIDKLVECQRCKELQDHPDTLKEIRYLLLELKYRRDWTGPGEVDKVIDRLIELTNEIAGIVDEATERCKEKP